MKTNKAVYWAVCEAVFSAVHRAVDVAVYRAVYGAVNGDVYRAVRVSVTRAVNGAVWGAVFQSLNDPGHPGLQDFLVSCGAEVEV
jgi:hypothetical protein